MLNVILGLVLSGEALPVVRDVRVEGFHVFVSLNVKGSCMWDVQEHVPSSVIFDKYETGRSGKVFSVVDREGVTAHSQYLELAASDMQNSSFTVQFDNITSSTPLEYALHSRYPPLGSPYKVCLNTTAISKDCSNNYALPPACWVVPAANLSLANEVSLITTIAIWVSAVLCSVTTYLK
eukprot:TRINITY_DN2857_c0_g1_i1.p1 TRINITY_DN2857_c0_g1~~TRINITY_DN2857_c0_g1_i1.p1  ORF type:complete len:179 (+),score=13.83 TRINITY_DN2857_c0_g1_i1:36-572(+)